MQIEIKMPALSPTMEEGTLARWLVKPGDAVSAGDVLAEIETDKATMEFEAVDDGTIGSIAVEAGTSGVKVGTVIAVLEAEGDAAPASAPETAAAPQSDAAPRPAPAPAPVPVPAPATAEATAAAKPAADAAKGEGKRISASPLARRMARERGIDLAGVAGSGPHGRIVRSDIDAAPAAASAPAAAARAAAAPAADASVLVDERVPHVVEKLSLMRKTIARRLAQSMQEAPHIYLTVDVRIDRLLSLRAEINETLAATGREAKVSVNDMLVKALGLALIKVPECNVSFGGTSLVRYSRADISVAVSIPGGLITPIVENASGRSVVEIAEATKDLGARAKAGKLKPEEFQGGTASISNMGMMGIKHFTAVINPPQGMILAVGAGERRPWVLDDGTLGVATVMTVTGSFDHRAIDGADGARLLAAFRELVERPLSLLA